MPSMGGGKIVNKTEFSIFKRIDGGAWEPADAVVEMGDLSWYAKLAREDNMEVAVFTIVPNAAACTPPLVIVPPWSKGVLAKDRTGVHGYKKGDAVKFKKPGKTSWFKGVVESVQEDRTVTVYYNDTHCPTDLYTYKSLWHESHLKFNMASPSSSSSQPSAASASASSSASAKSSSKASAATAAAAEDATSSLPSTARSKKRSVTTIETNGAPKSGKRPACRELSEKAEIVMVEDSESDDDVDESAGDGLGGAGEDDDDTLMCLVCAEARKCILQIPCGHMNTCASAKCRSRGTKCWQCRVVTERTVEVTELPPDGKCVMCDRDMMKSNATVRPMCNFPCGCTQACEECLSKVKSPKCIWCRTVVRAKQKWW